MTVSEIAHDLVALCRAGRFAEASLKHWADDVISIEPMGDPAIVRGKQAVYDKGQAWAAANTVHSLVVGAPYVSGDQFAVRFTVDQTSRSSGERTTLDEIALYTVRDGKIVEERFFYADPG